jgi:hypothetical protein
MPRGDFPARGAGLFPLGRFVQPEFLDPISNLIPIQPEERGGLRLVPARARQGLEHEFALDGLEPLDPAVVAALASPAPADWTR